MFKSIFSNLQKIGKSLMLPISVLPIAGILLGIGSANFKIVPKIVSYIISEAGGSVFANMPLIFAIGITLGFTKNDGIAALATVVAYNIMTNTLLVVSSILLHAPLEEIQSKHLVDTGVLGGILTGVLSAYMFNIFYCIQLPEYLGFFTGKRFVPIVSGLSAILLGIILAFIWPPIGYVIKQFSEWAAYHNPVLAFGLYGVIERALVPCGLHHIWNVPFQMQIGEYSNALGQTFHGDIARYIAGDTTAGKLSGGFLFKMYGLPGAALAIWKCAKNENKKKVGGMMMSAALTAFLTGITEPIEFSFILVAPILYVVHSLLAGLAFPICILLNMRSGTSFSHGFIDFMILSGNSSNVWLFPIVGILYSALYYAIFCILINKFNLNTPGREKQVFSHIIEINNKLAQAIVTALGGKKNITNVDACITRLRIAVNDSSKVQQLQLKKLGAMAVIISGLGVQAVFGTKSDNIKTVIEKHLNSE